MCRHLLVAALLSLLAACNAPPRAPKTASSYAGRADTVPQTLLGSQLQADSFVAPIRDQLRRFARSPAERTQGNVTAYKFQLASLTNAMQADMTRVGGNVDAVRSLGDSVMNDLGGGTGPARGFDNSADGEARLRQHTARVERLIGLYESAIRQSPGSGAKR